MSILELAYQQYMNIGRILNFMKKLIIENQPARVSTLSKFCVFLPSYNCLSQFLNCQIKLFIPNQNATLLWLRKNCAWSSIL